MNISNLAAAVSRLLGTLVLAGGLIATANAADEPSVVNESGGPYVGVGLGFSKLGPRNEAPGSNGGPHEHGPEVAKIYGGFRFTDHWGVEAGWAQLGRVHDDTLAADGSISHHPGNAHSVYLAGTGRMALGHGFSLIGKAGISFGHVSAKASGDSGFTLGGSKAAPLLGVGAEYSLKPNLDLTFDLDGFGKVSDSVKASSATVGIRYRF